MTLRNILEYYQNLGIVISFKFLTVQESNADSSDDVHTEYIERLEKQGLPRNPLQ